MLDARITRGPAAGRVGTRRHYLMCPPEFFAVVYAINPWMDPTRSVDPVRTRSQWDALHRAYVEAGHVIETIPPRAGLPDMVFAANSAFVLDGIAYLARFRHPQRTGEEALYARWFREHGLTVHESPFVHEGEGDFALAGDVILAAAGFRTDVEAHAEAQRVFRREVVTLQLVDPRFYHLDTALCVLDDAQVVYYPAAFADHSRAELRRRFPDAILATAADAVVFGCNAACDGAHVFLPAGADHLTTELSTAGYDVIPLDLSELRKAGGSVKCCTLELRYPEEVS